MSDVHYVPEGEPHGFNFAQATNDVFSVAAMPHTDFARKALNDARDRYMRAHPTADPSTLIWTVTREDGIQVDSGQLNVPPAVRTVVDRAPSPGRKVTVKISANTDEYIRAMQDAKVSADALADALRRVRKEANKFGK